MDVTISLPDELGRQLMARANREGLDIANFIVKVAKRETNNEVPASGRDTARVNWQEKAEKLRQALAWIRAHRAEYAGQWVCLDGGQLISHGREAKSVYAEADAQNIPSPFVEYIAPENLPFGGW